MAFEIRAEPVHRKNQQRYAQQRSKRPQPAQKRTRQNAQSRQEAGGSKKPYGSSRLHIKDLFTALAPAFQGSREVSVNGASFGSDTDMSFLALSDAVKFFIVAESRLLFSR
jgi:hypothetical protein